MLKLCLDCIVGTRTENEEPHSTQLNGNTHKAPPWPISQYNNEIMFILPKQLSAGDQINVAGNMMNNPKTLTISLMTGNMSPDYENIACQLEATFPSNPNNPNHLSLKIIEDGNNEEITGDYQSFLATELFTDLSFNFGFTIRVNGNYQSGYLLDIYVGESFLEQVKLKHNIEDIKFLTLSGDVTKVNKLDFQFA